jgi:hypothetical protein
MVQWLGDKAQVAMEEGSAFTWKFLFFLLKLKK